MILYFSKLQYCNPNPDPDPDPNQVTIGNILAGAVIFAGSYSYLYGALGGHTKD